MLEKIPQSERREDHCFTIRIKAARQRYLWRNLVCQEGKFGLGSNEQYLVEVSTHGTERRFIRDGTRDPELGKLVP